MCVCVCVWGSLDVLETMKAKVWVRVCGYETVLVLVGRKTR